MARRYPPRMSNIKYRAVVYNDSPGITTPALRIYAPDDLHPLAIVDLTRDTAGYLAMECVKILSEKEPQ